MTLGLATAIDKGPAAFRSISEAAAELGIASHVLRFWETKFAFIRPMKRAGGRRFYRPRDLEMLRGVRVLLHDEGYTIKGVQRLHKEQGVGRMFVAAGSLDADLSHVDLLAAAQVDRGVEAEPASSPPIRPTRAELDKVLENLEQAKAAIDAMLAGSRELDC